MKYVLWEEDYSCTSNLMVYEVSIMDLLIYSLFFPVEEELLIFYIYLLLQIVVESIQYFRQHLP